MGEIVAQSRVEEEETSEKDGEDGVGRSAGGRLEGEEGTLDAVGCDVGEGQEEGRRKRVETKDEYMETAVEEVGETEEDEEVSRLRREVGMEHIEGDEEDVGDVMDALGDVEDDAGLEDETVDHDEVGDEDSKVHVPEECVEYVASLQADGAH